MMKELLSKSEYETIRIGIVVIMMLASIMPTEIRWMRCEMWFFHCIPALFIFGLGILFWYKKMLDCRRSLNFPWQAPEVLTKDGAYTIQEERDVRNAMQLCSESFDL